MGSLTSEYRDSLGWALTILICAVVVINLIITLTKMIRSLIEFIKTKCLKKEKNQEGIEEISAIIKLKAILNKCTFIKN